MYTVDSRGCTRTGIYDDTRHTQHTRVGRRSSLSLSRALSLSSLLRCALFLVCQEWHKESGQRTRLLRSPVCAHAAAPLARCQRAAARQDSVWRRGRERDRERERREPRRRGNARTVYIYERASAFVHAARPI